MQVGLASLTRPQLFEARYFFFILKRYPYDSIFSLCSGAVQFFVRFAGIADAATV